MTTVSRRPALTPRQLTRTGERLSFVYLERCAVHQDANAITAEDADRTTHIPSATISTLLLGPGTRITHQAMSVLGESGAAVCWVGEQGVRYYAAGRALTRSSRLAEAQAVQWANVRSRRLAVARAMYRLRFPDEDPAGLTRKELLGREGSRVKDCSASWRSPAAPSSSTSPTCTRPRSASRSPSTSPPKRKKTSARAPAVPYGTASTQRPCSTAASTTSNASCCRTQPRRSATTRMSSPSTATAATPSPRATTMLRHCAEIQAEIAHRLGGQSPLELRLLIEFFVASWRYTLDE